MPPGNRNAFLKQDVAFLSEVKREPKLDPTSDRSPPLFHGAYCSLSV
jgi:hypothetical protein